MNTLIIKTKSLFSRERIVSTLSVPIMILLLLGSTISIPKNDFETGVMIVLLANILVELHFIKDKLNNK